MEAGPDGRSATVKNAVANVVIIVIVFTAVRIVHQNFCKEVFAGHVGCGEAERVWNKLCHGC